METAARTPFERASEPTLDLSCFLEAIPETAVLIDDRRRIVGANWRFRERTTDSAHCVGRHCYEVLHRGAAPCSAGVVDCPFALGSILGEGCSRLHVHRAGPRTVVEEVRTTPLGDPSAPRLVLQTLRRPGDPSLPPPGRLVGHSPAMLELRWRIHQIRNRIAPVVVFGEAGTERELVARALHDVGPRAEGPFALAFAVEPGDEAADRSAWPSRSVLRASASGTLFLDDLTTLPRDRQRDLLSLLSGRPLEPDDHPWGGFLDARWIFGSTRPVEDAVRERRLLPELAGLLARAEIEVPPLRRRGPDIPVLIQALRPWLIAPLELEIDPAVAAPLASLPLYGNLDELRHRLQCAVLAAGRGTMRPEHLAFD